MVGFVRTTATAALLLLSSGLVRFALGSFSSRADAVSSDFDFDVVRGQVKQIHAMTTNQQDIRSASAITTATAGPPGRDLIHLDFLGKTLSLSSELFPRAATDSRKLQESTCAGGTPTFLSVSSTVFPLMEGCFSAAVVVDGNIVYFTDTAIITILEPSTTTDTPLWIAGYQASTDEVTTACISIESADDVNPAEATWLCFEDGGDSAFIPTDEELSISCGCTTASPSPTTASPPPAPSSEQACGEGDAFSIVSDSFPEAEGCYLDTAVDNNDSPVYSSTGNLDVEQVFVFAVESVLGDTSTIVWGLINVLHLTSSDANEVWCISEAEAALYHPSEVPLWQCDVDGDGIRETAGGVLSVSCGCPIATPSPSISPTPVPSPTVPACGEGESFSVESDTLPVTEGCYVDTAYVLNDNPIYTTSGTDDIGQIWVVAAEVTSEDTSTGSTISWVLVYVAATDSSEDNTFYCNSEVEAALYHPSEILDWICIAGAAIAVKCGCSSTPSTGTPSPVPSSSDQPAVSPVSRGLPTPVPSPPTSTTAQPALSPIARELPTPPPSPAASPTGQPAVSPISRGLPTPLPSPPASPAAQPLVSTTSPPVVSSTFPPIATPTSPPASPTLQPFQPVVSSMFPLTPVPGALPTAEPGTGTAPTPAPSPVFVVGPPSIPDTCSGNGSFTITANAAPNLDGCFVDTEEDRPDESLAYTVTGTTENAEIVVLSLVADDGHYKWMIEQPQRNGDARVYCISSESAREVNPGNASWLCDFVGDSGIYSATTEDDISIVCGACPASTEEKDASSASKLALAIVTAAGASMVVAASFAAGWC